MFFSMKSGEGDASERVASLPWRNLSEASEREPCGMGSTDDSQIPVLWTEEVQTRGTFVRAGIPSRSLAKQSPAVKSAEASRAPPSFYARHPPLPQNPTTHHLTPRWHPPEVMRVIVASCTSGPSLLRDPPSRGGGAAYAREGSIERH